MSTIIESKIKGIEDIELKAGGLRSSYYDAISEINRWLGQLKISLDGVEVKISDEEISDNVMLRYYLTVKDNKLQLRIEKVETYYRDLEYNINVVRMMSTRTLSRFVERLVEAIEWRLKDAQHELEKFREMFKKQT